MNYMGACCGASSVYDEWAEISDDNGLKWKSLYNEFTATVHFTKQDLDYEKLNANGKGLLELTAPTPNLELALDLVSSWVNVLCLRRVDMSGGTGLGVSTDTQSIKPPIEHGTLPSQILGRSCRWG
jgi:choline dehydrogenase